MVDPFLTRMRDARGFASKLWSLTRPYWYAEERQEIGLLGFRLTLREAWIARGLLALIVGLSFMIVYVSKLLNAWNARFFNALQDANADGAMAAMAERGVFPRLADGPHLLSHGADAAGHRQSRTTHRAGLRLIHHPDAQHRPWAVAAGADLDHLCQRAVGAVRQFCDPDLRRHRHSRLHDVGGGRLRPVGLICDISHWSAAGGHKLRAGASQRRFSLSHGTHPRELGKHRPLPRRARRGAVLAHLVCQHL